MYGVYSSREDVELVVDRVELEREADAVLVLAGEPVAVLDLKDVLVNGFISDLLVVCTVSLRSGRCEGERAKD